jgi:lysophospholipase L1-like esterase
MLDENKEVLKDIFVQDKLHMNEKGYAIWIKIIGPKLLK